MEFATLVKKISPTLKRIAYKLNGHFTSFNHDDMYQEALMHLWVDYNEGKLADKTDSYILQGCYFHLKNYIRKDSDKARFVSLEGCQDNEDGQQQSATDYLLHIKDPQDYLELAHCNLVIEQINNNGLTKREKEVFSFALEGLTTREIGARLGISHVMVVKIKGRIKSKCWKHLDR